MARNTVSVILLNYNGASILPVIQQGIEGVKGQTVPDWELILVDDGSTDRSDAFLASFADGRRIHFVQAPHRGVGAARNAGLRRASGRYLAFIDNDAIPEPTWLERVIGFMEEHPEVGAAASLVFFADRPGVINSAGCVLNELAHGIGVGMHQLYPFFTPPPDCMYPTGNGMVLRRQALEQVGWFDEGFLFYGHDDSDIGIRIRDTGYEIALVEDAVLFHLHSTSKRDPAMNFWDLRNRLRFVLKHYSVGEWLYFLRHDALPRLRGKRRGVYWRAWRSAFQNWQDLRRYRQMRPSREGFLRRYREYYQPERRYLAVPDNRLYARTWKRIGLGVVVGDNEEDYLYQGWYRRVQDQEGFVRWAMPVASLRFEVSQPFDRVDLSWVLPDGLDQQRLRIHLYPWSDRWYLTTPETAGVVDLRGGTPATSQVTMPIAVEPGRYLLVFEAERHVQGQGFFPRRRAWGLVSMEVGRCAS